jgi:organic hydroperoxide reductase OsmC/OhrA
MAREVTFSSKVAWTGNTGEGTASAKSYTRDLEISPDGKPPIPGSTAPAFGGDPARYDPEDLLVAAVSSCHMLWYLHLASVAGVVVTSYSDNPTGRLELVKGGAGQFTQIVLKPRVAITASSDVEKARALHDEAHAMCFIARSINFPVHCEPLIVND